MIIKISRIVLFVILSVSLLFGGQKIKEKDLAPQQREWLKLVGYIIRPEEREVFLQLADNWERDLFIQTFWNQRDPTPGTPQNEYKDQHIERVQYTNKFFRYSSKEGWMTDRGRIYIILGPPVSIETLHGSGNIYPSEIWSYYGDPAKDLPSHFSLVFFQRRGIGEYQLYDPVADGPSSLFVEGRDMDPFDYKALYDVIRERSPTLASVCLSYVPGDIPFDFQPSLFNTTILANIYESPKKDVNPTYSTHFLKYKGVVSTEYLTNYVESATDIAFIQDPLTGINFLHFSIAPGSLSIDYYAPNDQYFCNYTLNVSLKTGEETIFQYDREFPFYFSEDELNKVRSNGIALEDSFPAVEGRYDLNILITNSVGKEFSVHERKIVVSNTSDSPQINGPFLGYGFHDSDMNQHMPFKAVNKKLLYDPKKTYSRHEEIALLFNLLNMTEDLWRRGEVKISIKGLSEKSTIEKTYALKLANYPYKRILSIDQLLPAEELTPDYYVIRLSFFDGEGRVLDEKSTEFAVSLAEEVSHPMARMKPFSLQNQFLLYYMMAEQHSKLKENEKAEENFEKAFNLNKNYTRGVSEYAHFLLKVNKFERSLELVEHIKQDERLQYDYNLIKGLAHMGLEKYMQAIGFLEEGNKIYNSDTRLLNSLGFCYHKTAQKSKALDVLKASLRLNPEQEDVKMLMAAIEKNTPSDCFRSQSR